MKNMLVTAFMVILCCVSLALPANAEPLDGVDGEEQESSSDVTEEVGSAEDLEYPDLEEPLELNEPEEFLAGSGIQVDVPPDPDLPDFVQEPPPPSVPIGSINPDATDLALTNVPDEGEEEESASAEAPVVSSEESAPSEDYSTWGDIAAPPSLPDVSYNKDEQTMNIPTGDFAETPYTYVEGMNSMDLIEQAQAMREQNKHVFESVQSGVVLNEVPSSPRNFRDWASLLALIITVIVVCVGWVLHYFRTKSDPLRKWWP